MKKMEKLTSLLLVCICLWNVSVNLTDAVCCENYGYRCPGGRRCCGIGECNFFCCGCYGGCMGSYWPYKRKFGKRDLTSREGGIQHIDQDGDNVVNKTEGYAYIKSGACGDFSGDFREFEKHFTKLDKDGDGALTHEEIDGSG